MIRALAALGGEQGGQRRTAYCLWSAEGAAGRGERTAVFSSQFLVFSELLRTREGLFVRGGRGGARRRAFFDPRRGTAAVCVQPFSRCAVQGPGSVIQDVSFAMKAALQSRLRDAGMW